MDPLVHLAAAAIKSYVANGREGIPSFLMDAAPSKKAGVFVTIHSASGELRGCIGTILPTCETMAYEIIQNARSACSRDHRFAPVQENELESLTIKVDVLSEPEHIDSASMLDPSRYGVIVSAKDGRRGLLLPALDGVDTAMEQIAICRRKGGIRDDEPITLQRFTVERHG